MKDLIIEVKKVIDNVFSQKNYEKVIDDEILFGNTKDTLFNGRTIRITEEYDSDLKKSIYNLQLMCLDSEEEEYSSTYGVMDCYSSNGVRS